LTTRSPRLQQLRIAFTRLGQTGCRITGSAGKTTAKELTAHVLKSAGHRVLKSERNYNNGLGLPLVGAAHGERGFVAGSV
jgi:UDP-N-acetylmuramyl pentapeptide synthase